MNELRCRSRSSGEGMSQVEIVQLHRLSPGHRQSYQLPCPVLPEPASGQSQRLYCKYYYNFWFDSSTLQYKVSSSSIELNCLYWTVVVMNFLKDNGLNKSSNYCWKHISFRTFGSLDGFLEKEDFSCSALRKNGDQHRKKFDEFVVFKIYCTTLLLRAAIFLPKMRETMLKHGKNMLVLCCVQNIEDKAVTWLAESCPQLHYLCLSGCSHLTDQALIILAQYSHHLSTLEVAGCSQFTDTGFQALARVNSQSTFGLLVGLWSIWEK